MAILDILQYPDPRLNLPAQRVEKIDAATRKLIDDMTETMYAAPGVGLAATQVDCPKQIIVI
jgi:peptide deformylase